MIMSYLSSTSEKQPRSWESSPTLTPGSVFSRTSSNYDFEEGDIEERKRFVLSSEERSSHRYARIPRTTIICVVVAALFLITWCFWQTSYPQVQRVGDISLNNDDVRDFMHQEQAIIIQKSVGNIVQEEAKFMSDEIEPSSVEIVQKSVDIAQMDNSTKSWTHYMDDISRFFKDVRLDNPDGLAFAQMGFRTRLYAHMLQQEQQNTTEFIEREKNMWFFLPGIEKIRKRAQSRQVDGRPTRGIILSADSSRFVYTCHFLAMLRNYHKSTLPVEIFYLGDLDLPKSMRDHLVAQYNVTTIDLAKDPLYNDDFAKLGGYAIKPFALLATSFSEVLLSDADTVLLSAPEVFFDQKGYREHGTLFFQDRLVDHFSESGHNFLVQQMGYRQVSEKLSQTPFWKKKLKHLQESGIVVMDRSRPEVFAASLFTAWQNLQLMRETVLDRHFWGDKESFWMAFELADFSYYMVNKSCGAIGQEHVEYADPKQGFCTEHPLHFFDSQHGEGLPDPAGNNRTLGKPAWFNGSLRLNKYNGDKKLLDPTDDTIFVMNGTWTYYDETRRWCLTDYKRFGIHEYNLGVILGRLGRASREGERMTTAVTG